MADLEKTINIVFGGDDRVSKAVRSINSSLATMELGAQQIATPFAKLADGVIAADAAIAALAVGGMALAVREAGAFTGQVAEINTLADLSGSALGAFSSDILTYADDSRIAVDQINAALYQAISLGTDYQDSLTAIEQAERLAVGGRADLVASTELLLGTMNAYGAGVDEATRYSDAFFTIVRDGKTSVPELAQYMAEVTGIASAGQVPIETLGAAIAAITASGAPTSQAMTRIKAAIEGIINPTDSARDAAGALGVQFGSQALAAKGLDGVLADVYTRTGGNVEVMAQLFTSTEALQAALVLGADASGTFAKTLEDMQNKTGATEAAYAKMVDSAELDNQRLFNTIKTTLIRVGLEIEEQRHDITNAFADIFKAVGAAVDTGAFDELFGALDRFGDRISDYVTAIATAMPAAFEAVDFDGLIAAFGELGDEVAAYFEGVDLTTADGLATALQGVVDTITALTNVTAGMVAAFQPYFDALAEAVRRARDMDGETAQAFGNVLLMAQAVVTAGAGVATAFATIQATGAEMSDVFDVVAGSVKAAWNLLSAVFDEVAQRGVDAALVVVEAAGMLNRALGLGGLNGPLIEIKNNLLAFRAAIEEHAVEEMADAVEGAKQAWNGLTGATSEARTAVETLGAAVNDIPRKDVDIALANHEELTAKLREMGVLVEDIPAGEVSVTADTKPAEQQFETLSTTLEDGRTVSIKVPVDQASVNAANAKLESDIPDAKLVSLEPTVDADALEAANAKLRIQTDLMKEQVEWKAKVDIAQAEASAKEVEAAFGSVDEGMKSTGDTITELTKSLGDQSSVLARWRIEDQIRNENRRRDAEIGMQEDLIAAKVRSLDAQTERMKDTSGAVIEVNGSGLAPHLEAFMFEILQAIQVRANAEGAEFLIGLG